MAYRSVGTVYLIPCLSCKRSLCSRRGMVSQICRRTIWVHKRTNDRKPWSRKRIYKSAKDIWPARTCNCGSSAGFDEIARFFDIPASTLRYWEDKGVLYPGKKSENQYREYTIEDLMTISDVIFYKNLGLQLKEICGMEASTPKQHHELFAEKIV